MIAATWTHHRSLFLKPIFFNDVERPSSKLVWEALVDRFSMIGLPNDIENPVAADVVSTSGPSSELGYELHGVCFAQNSN